MARLTPPWLLFGLFVASCATAPAPTPAPAGTTTAASTTATVAAAPKGPEAPVARKVPYVRELHGDRFVDDYFWLREKGTPEVERYLNAENEHTDKSLAHLEGLREQLFQKIVSHIAEDDESAPVKDGDFLHWRRLSKGKSYPIFLRKKVAKDAPEEVVLDQNVLAEGKAFLGLGDLEPSDDGRWLAFSLDETGFRQFTLQFEELATKKRAPERIERVTSLAWAADGKTVLYCVEDDAKRPYRVLRHVVGTDPKTDAVVYEEKDGRFEVYVGRTASRAFITITSESKRASEVRLVDTKRPASAPIVVEPRAEDVKYFVEHRGKELFIRTNDTGVSYRLVSAPVAKPGKKGWKELRAHDRAVMLEDLAVFEGHYVLTIRQAGLPHLEVHDFATKRSERIAMPETNYAVMLDDNPDPKTREVRYRYTSLSTPWSTYVYDVVKKTSALLKQDAVPGGFDRASYESEYVFATAKDGTRVPISLVYKKGLKRDGTAPLLLQGYGSYGFPSWPAFRAERLALLDRGVVWAVAHVRGGGDLGKEWHEAGRMAQKMNTFTDFIACAEHLIAERYTSADHLAIQGGSAGGLLMGAVVNLRPDLFRAVLSYVPFVDVVNTMNDPTLPLTITEYEEWGNPNVAEQYRWMRAYSPYDNLEAKRYPAMLVRSSYNDSQVMYWEPAKYVARLRTLKVGDEPLLLKVLMEPAGHGGKSGRYDRYRDVAYDYAFLLAQLGLAKG
ncbi:S9 family peptidase [Myxococcota bacterium]|nr:S9 family peptidase [Myxococcota bacterium]